MVFGEVAFIFIVSFFSQKSEAQVVTAWWNLWPKFTLGSDLSTVQGTDSNVITSANGMSDEGRSPLFRVLDYQNNQTKIQSIQAQNIKQLSWIEGQGQARSIIGAINRAADGSFEVDPNTGAAKIYANNWSWDSATDAILTNPTNIVWFGPTSFINSEDWLGTYTVSNPQWGLTVPTYHPDDGGAPATGWNGSSSDPRNSKFYDAIACKDINGVVQNDLDSSGTKATGKLQVAMADGTTKTVGDMSIARDQASPWWLAYDLAAAKYSLLHGADGFWEDNITGWDTIGATPIKVAFGNWSVATFRQFLKDHQISVDDPDHFDVRAYLKSLLQTWYGLTATQTSNLSLGQWADKRFLSDPVWQAYLVHKSTISGNRARDIYSGIKNMVTQLQINRGGKILGPDDIYIGGNDAPAISFADLQGQEQDTVNTEATSGWSLDLGATARGIPPLGHAGPFYATATRFAKSQHAVVWFYLEGEGAPYKQKTSLGEVMGFEALANNTLLNFDPGNSNTTTVGTVASNLHVHQVIDRMAPIFGVRSRSGQVAILHSSQTQLSWLTPGGFYGFSKTTSDPNDPGYMDHNLSFNGWGSALEELHVPYRVIPDFRLSQSELTGISVLILPHVRVIDPTLVSQVLIPFTNQGGTLVITGSDAGSLNTPANLFQKNSGPLLANLNGQTGVVFLSGNPGFDFMVTRTTPTSTLHTNSLQNLSQTISNLESNGNLAQELNFSGWGNRVRATTYLSALSSDTCFIDLVNVDINLTQDQITPASGGSLTISNPNNYDLTTVTVTFYDADGSQGVNLPVTVSEDAASLTVTVPTFRVYGSLVIKGQPPQSLQ